MTEREQEINYLINFIADFLKENNLTLSAHILSGEAIPVIIDNENDKKYCIVKKNKEEQQWNKD